MLSLILVTFCAALIAVVSQLLTGFGFALIMVPMLLLVVAPAQAILVSVALGAVMCLAMVWRDRQHIDRIKLIELLAGSLFGLPLGVLILRWLPDPVLKWIIVASVLAALLVVIANLTLRNRRSTTVGIGVLSGSLLTSTGINGPPLVALLRANNYSPSRYRATLAGIFAVQNTLATGLLLSAGVMTQANLIMFGAGLLALPAAFWAGELLFRRIDAQRLRQAIIVMLLICLASVLWFR